MARIRNKEYKQGDRINIYLSRDLTPEFIDWINQQSDLSNFFLYAAQQLHKQTGTVDVSEVMPRKINFHLPKTDKPTSKMEEPVEKRSIPEPEPLMEEKEFIDESQSIKKDETWANIEDMDDDGFA
ncbi:hypothetical protein [Halalkalibacter flavus]|uniref:hypothetical protein n=1 Tax=Halalkalibacter flavus TaxID=3090668 RepID=UPI002FC6A136